MVMRMTRILPAAALSLLGLLAHGARAQHDVVAVQVLRPHQRCRGWSGNDQIRKAPGGFRARKPMLEI